MNNDNETFNKQFPEGQISKDDEGGLVIGIAHQKNQVHIKFETPVEWFALGPKQAAELSVLIFEHAMKAGFKPPLHH